MKKILIILFIMYSQYLFAQVDENKIKIVAKNYFSYEFSDVNAYDNESDGAVKVDELKDEEVSKDSILIDVVEISYPYIQTPDSLLNAFINDTILKIVGIDVKNNASEKMNILYDSLEEMPSISYTTFTVNYISSAFISLTINQDEEACCGAAGASHRNIPVTFDLVNKKNICFEDVIRKKKI